MHILPLSLFFAASPTAVPACAEAAEGCLRPKLPKVRRRRVPPFILYPYAVIMRRCALRLRATVTVRTGAGVERGFSDQIVMRSTRARCDDAQPLFLVGIR